MVTSTDETKDNKMATNCLIGMKTGDNQITAIYCHHDGYPSYIMPILVNHYTTVEKVQALLDLGDISVLDETIGIKIGFDDYEKRSVNKQCLAYGRDRNEPNTKAFVYTQLEFEYEQQYAYCFDPETKDWTCYKGD